MEDCIYGLLENKRPGEVCECKVDGMHGMHEVYRM